MYLLGNFYDLRLFKTFLTLALPKENLEFLMSGSNQVCVLQTILSDSISVVNVVYFRVRLIPVLRIWQITCCVRYTSTYTCLALLRPNT